MPPTLGAALPSPSPDRERVRCPTCRVEQDWADTCRRCRSDLRLLRELADTYHQTRLACLAHLGAGYPRAALRLAHQCRELSASAESDRLLAVCSLAARDWPTALALGRRLGAGDRAE
jgi:hypothetical protein